MKEKFKPALAYHFLTPIYDRFNSALGFGKPFIWRVIDIAELKKDHKVLDVGTGTGIFILEAIQRYPEIKITGVDPDKNALHIAQSKLKAMGRKANLVQGYAQELPFPDGSFDVVVSTLAFHHMPDEVKHDAIKEIRRVLTKHGRFILADFGKPQTVTSRILLNLGSIFDGRANMVANLEGKIPELLANVGFTITNINPRYKGVQFLVAKK
jgi:ubiquinone/menaquinone biosynthesis C-methylase UbiE